LRRLLRRAALFGRRLGKGKPFLTEVARTTIQKMGHIYPEVVQRGDFIIRVVESEEARFKDTLSTGLELLDEIIEATTSKKENKIPGEAAFKLYDTYGFPVELTTEIVSGSGLSVDLAGFEKEMEQQRERARAAHKFEMKGTVRVGDSLDIKASCFIGYKNLECSSTIVDLLVANKPTKTIKEGQEAGVILESTPFYGEMGGQVGDTGEIVGSSGKFSVSKTVRVPPDIIVHQGKVIKGSISVGDEVEAIVDEERRLDIARNHTATHLLQMALRQVLGGHVQQRGSLVDPDRLRFDFSHLEALTREQVQKVSHLVNDKIRQNLIVHDQTMSYQKAIEDGAIALFDEKYGDEVRVVKIGESVISTELCAGTHVNATGEIGFFQIISEGGIGAGLRRIEAVTGRGAEEFINGQLKSLHNVAESLESSPAEVQNKISSLLTELDAERRRALSLERELAERTVMSLLDKVEMVNGVRIIAARVSPYRMEALREISDQLREQLKSVVIVLGTIHNNKPIFLAAVTPDLVAKGYNAGQIVNQVAKVAGGRGGGKAHFAQAGGRHKDKLDEALRSVKTLI